MEVAVEALRDIARELHQLDIKSVKQKKTGYLTSTVGSGVLGGALVGGLLTAGPVVSLGLFAGTVLTSLGQLIALTGREGRRGEELELQVRGSLSEAVLLLSTPKRDLPPMWGILVKMPPKLPL